MIENLKSNVKSYVLRQGRMSNAQRRSYENLSSRYCLEKGRGDLFFANSNPLVIEIGFGMGRATALIAEQNPDVNYLGIEVYRPGIGKLLWEIEKRGLENIRIIEGDAAEIISEEIPEKSAAGFHIFFPDPWPKKRHHKRRLITRPFTDVLASRLAGGGYIYMVTDSADYGAWALLELSMTSGLANTWAGGFAPPQERRPRTEFEAKGIAKQHEIKELYFVKNA